jgi:flagellar export protein FliJ
MQTELEEARTRQQSAALAATRTALARLETARGEAGREIVQAAACSPGDLATLAGYRRGLILRKQSLRAQEQEGERRLAEQRQRWMEARRKCRLLEKLKERRQAEHALLVNRELDAIAGEMFLSRWSR